VTNYLIMDIETDALDATRIWVICTEDYNTGEKQQFLNTDTIPEERERFLDYLNGYDKFVFHNGIGFDAPVINKLLGTEVIPLECVADTLILSRLFDYGVQGGHSLKAWGLRLGNFKLDFNDFTMLTEEMVKYCHQDVTVTRMLFKKFKKDYEDPNWSASIKCEHEIQMLCEQMSANGFTFDKDSAVSMLKEIEHRMEELNVGFQKDFPPQLVEVNRLMYKVKADGQPYASVASAREKYVMTKVDKSVVPNELACFDFVSFSPASPKQRIDRLWEAGWTPYEKTKGHIEYDREKQQQQQRRRSPWR
jgi:DNA polymerase I